MTLLPTTGAAPLSSTAEIRTATNVSSTRPAPALEQPQPGQEAPATQFTRSPPRTEDVVYARPQAPAPEALRFEAVTVWASPQDAISERMDRNRRMAEPGNLAELWRGLGGALLARFAETGSDYRQTVADYLPSTGAATGTAATGSVDGAKALQASALDTVDIGAATVKLTVRTRSGQSVELTIAANDGRHGGTKGLQVAVKSSGPLDSAERAALGQLADGLDAALHGLGQADQPRLDLAKLMDYDRSVLAGLELGIENPDASQALTAFTLRLGDERKTLAMRSALGNIDLRLDATTPTGGVDAQQRQAALEEHLRRFDAVGQRSRADLALVELFKDAFTRLHDAPAGETTAAMPVPALAKKVQALQSGLADFEASFSGEYQRTNRLGFISETGEVEYRLRQETTQRQDRVSGNSTTTQTLSEQLDAQALKAHAGGILDTSSGYYDIVKIHDSRTLQTLIETNKDRLTQAVRTREERQLRTVDELENHRIVDHQGTPSHRRTVERLA